jgi:hypothetical protein
LNWHIGHGHTLRERNHRWREERDIPGSFSAWPWSVTGPLWHIEDKEISTGALGKRTQTPPPSTLARRCKDVEIRSETVPKVFVPAWGFSPKLGSNLGTIAPEHHTKRCYKKYAEPRKSNEIAHLDLSSRQNFVTSFLELVEGRNFRQADFWLVSPNSYRRVAL